MASGPITSVGNIAQALTTLHQASGASEFELRFNQLQNTVIGRLNKEIQKVNEAGGSKAELLSMQREGKALAANLPVVEKFILDSQTNSNRLATVYDKLASMVSLFSDDNAISAADVTSFNTLRQETVDELNKMWQLSYVGFTDGDIIRRLKNEITAFQALTPVEGVVDPAGTTPATNANRDVLTALETLQDKTSTAQTVTTNSIYTMVDVRENIMSKMSTIEADVTELNSSVQLQKLAEVEALKKKYGAILESISISYDASSGLAGSLNQQLARPIPEKGSVLNLFL